MYVYTKLCDCEKVGFGLPEKIKSLQPDMILHISIEL